MIVPEIFATDDIADWMLVVESDLLLQGLLDLRITCCIVFYSNNQLTFAALAGLVSTAPKLNDLGVTEQVERPTIWQIAQCPIGECTIFRVIRGNTRRELVKSVTNLLFVYLHLPDLKCFLDLPLSCGHALFVYLILYIL